MFPQRDKRYCERKPRNSCNSILCKPDHLARLSSLLALPLDEEAVETSVYSNKEVMFKQCCSVQRPTFELTDKTTHEADLDFFLLSTDEENIQPSVVTSKGGANNTVLFGSPNDVGLAGNCVQQGDFQQRSPCPAHMLGAFELQTNCLDHGLKINR